MQIQVATEKNNTANATNDTQEYRLPKSALKAKKYTEQLSSVQNPDHPRYRVVQSSN